LSQDVVRLGPTPSLLTTSPDTRMLDCRGLSGIHGRFPNGDSLIATWGCAAPWQTLLITPKLGREASTLSNYSSSATALRRVRGHSNDPGLEEPRLRKTGLAHLSKGCSWWLLFCPCSQVVGSPPLPQSTHLPYCDLPAETCRLARPAALHFIGIWRLLCTAHGEWTGSNCYTP
jgi:hypothetical protein